MSHAWVCTCHQMRLPEQLCPRCTWLAMRASGVVSIARGQALFQEDEGRQPRVGAGDASLVGPPDHRGRTVEHKMATAGAEKRVVAGGQQVEQQTKGHTLQAEQETPFLARVRALAKQHGWLTYHTHRSDRSEPGFPDLVLVRDSVIFAELKTNTGKPTHEQGLWLSLLCHAGAEAVVWRPADWDAIVERLTRRSAAP